MNHPPTTCPTPRLLRMLAVCQQAGKPYRWRANARRVWLSMGDPAPALVDAALRFPGALKNEESAK